MASTFTPGPSLMAELEFKSRIFQLKPHESVLDCLLRNGEAIPYACKAGMCQACLVKAVDCSATAESQKWVKAELRTRGYTLACQWVPENDVQVALPGIEEFSVAVRIVSMELVNPRVLCIRLTAEDPRSMFACRPGQYISVINPAGISRSYSIANDPALDLYVELHVAATAHGVFTHWLFSEASPGTRLHVRGPAGECFYTDIDGNDYPLVLAGTGTGLAPLYGIALDALRKGHRGEISLLHGGRNLTHLYHVDQLARLTGDHANFRYYPCVSDAPAPPGFAACNLETCLDSILQPQLLGQTRVFLCGAPDFVHGRRKQLFLKGVRAKHIHCDPFTERNVGPETSKSVD